MIFIKTSIIYKSLIGNSKKYGSSPNVTITNIHQLSFFHKIMYHIMTIPLIKKTTP